MGETRMDLGAILAAVVLTILIALQPFPANGNTRPGSAPAEKPAPIPDNVAGYEGTLYFGQLHDHTAAYGDDGTGTVAQNLNYETRNATPRLDFGGLSPHSHMVTSPDMLTYWSEMRAFDNSTFCAVPGQEWSTLSTSGHCNVYLASERCAVASGDIPGYYAWLNNSGGYCSFNHPWDNKRGLWLNGTSADYLMTAGRVLSSTAINLKAGWNLVGYPTLNPGTTVATAFAGTGADIVETFDGSMTYKTKVVASSYVMKPGEGYWVHVPSDTLWTINW